MKKIPKKKVIRKKNHVKWSKTLKNLVHFASDIPLEKYNMSDKRCLIKGALSSLRQFLATESS